MRPAGVLSYYAKDDYNKIVNTAQPLCVRRAVRFFVRLPKFDAALLAQGKENLGYMTENMQADDVQKR